MDVLLFSQDREYASAAVAAGVARVVVDWEWRGKAERQAGRDTEINRGTHADLAAMRAAVGDRVICRINNTLHGRDADLDAAIAHGASEIWLPMVRTVAEVEACLRRIDGRAGLGLMVETREAMRLGHDFAALPLSRLYVGLHDYRIDTGNAGMFDPLVDGTLDRFRDDYAGPIGVAGVTRPACGHPIPQRLLLAAMVRLACAFGVARRAFRADVPADRIGEALDELAAEVVRLRMRTPTEVDGDHALLRIETMAMALAQDVRTAEPALACAS